MNSLDMDKMDPLQQLIIHGIQREEGKIYMRALFQDELSGKTRHNLKEIALMCLIDIFENMKDVGVVRALEFYPDLKPARFSIFNISTKDERDAVEHLTHLLPSNDEESEVLLSPLLPYIDSITWDKLVTFSLLVREYNLEWALAAYDWGDKVSTDKGSPRGRKHG